MVKSIWDLSKPRMTIPREDLLADLKAYGKTLSGKPSSGADYSRWRNRRFSADTFRRMFGSWENACKEAGISKPKKNIFIPLMTYLNTWKRLQSGVKIDHLLMT